MEESKERNDDLRNIILPEGDYASYLATIAADMADQKMKQREARWRTIFSVVIAVLALFGYANISSFMNGITERVETLTNKRIDSIYKERYELLRREVDAKIAFVQLTTLASTLRDSSSFSDSDKNAVIELMRSIKHSEKLFESTEVTQPLEAIVDAFLAADLSVEIDKLDNELRSLLEKNQGIVLSLLQHYGMRAIGSADISPEDLKRFEHYAYFARESFHMPEAVLPFMLALEFRRNDNKRTDYGVELLKDASYLTDVERDSFIQIFNVLRNGDFYRSQTARTARIETTFSSLYEAYNVELKSLAQAADQSYEDKQLEQLLRLLEEAER